MLEASRGFGDAKDHGRLRGAVITRRVTARVGRPGRHPDASALSPLASATGRPSETSETPTTVVGTETGTRVKTRAKRGVFPRCRRGPPSSLALVDTESPRALGGGLASSSARTSWDTRDAEGLTPPTAVSRDARTWSRAASTDSRRLSRRRTGRGPSIFCGIKRVRGRRVLTTFSIESATANAGPAMIAASPHG